VINPADLLAFVAVVTLCIVILVLMDWLGKD
jgi:hypothetical protein